MHLREGAFGFLSEFYRGRVSRKALKALTRKISKGRSPFGDKYSVPWTMQSGWPDTSLGDTAVNMAMKLAIHGQGRLWISIVCGDDSVTVTTDTELRRLGGRDAIIKKYADHGMEVTLEVRYDPLDVEFCSGRFYPRGEGYILMPKIGKFLAKIACDKVNRSTRNQLAWLRGIAATCRSYGQVDPVIGALAVAIERWVGGGKVIADVANPYKNLVAKTTRPLDWDGICNYYDYHYGFSHSEVQQAVASVVGAGLFERSRCPLLRRMADRDCGQP